MGSTLLVYLFALVLRIPEVIGSGKSMGGIPSLWLAIILMFVMLVAVLAVCFIQTMPKSPLLLIKQYVLTPQLLIYAITVTAVALLLSGHRVMHWDDLSYWGTYVKTLLALDKIPSGLENCTIDYKDYTPIQQILQYVILHKAGNFDEANLFRVNVIFLYTMLLPLLEKINFKKSDDKYQWLKNALIIATYVLIPNMFSTQFYFKLGVDYLIAALFGYILCTIADEDERFKELRIVTAGSYLALIKTSGVVLALFASVFYCVYRYEAKEQLANKVKHLITEFLVTFTLPILAFASWKVWGRISGNHGYLSDRVTANVAGLKIVLPEYSREVIAHYIKNVIIYPLTREKIGMTALLAIAVIAVIFHVLQKGSEREQRSRNTRMHIFMCAGLFAFCCAHCYLYLAVFDEWEAHGLLEYDRYIIQYLGGVFIYYAWRMLRESSRKSRAARNLLPAGFVLLAVALFPYKSFVQYMIPANYSQYYVSQFKEFSDNAMAEWNEAKDSFEHLNWVPDEDLRVGFIADAWSDELEFLIYDMVPQPISFVFNTPAIEQGQLESFIRNQLFEKNIHYVYVMKNASASHADEWDESTRLLTADGEPLVPGCLYVSEEKNDNNWKLKRIE